MATDRLISSFYHQDVLEVAPSLIGKFLVRRLEDGSIQKHIITETEAYRGRDDLACHASKGKTPRTSIMFEPGGILYMYLIYGMYWMLNVVTAGKDVPQAVLIRGLDTVSGPGRLSRQLLLDKSFNGEDLEKSGRIWIANSGKEAHFDSTPRIGIDYAGEYWKNVPWRFVLKG